jgi:hypothetical protein
MPSYTSSLRLIQPTTGEYPGTWGTQVNTGITALVDNAVAGTANIAVGSTDYTLSTANGATDEARSAVLNLTAGAGVGARNIICPALSKLYVVYNNTGFTQTIKTLAQVGGVAVPTGKTVQARCDGTNVVEAITYISSDNVNFLQAGTGAVTTRTVQAKLRETVSVKDFGAAGDGSTDDSAAVQAAINTMTAGGTLVFPFGTYKINTSILVPYSNITILGNGSTIDATTLVYNPAVRGSGAVFRFVSPNATNSRTLTATAAAGTNTLTLSSTANAAAGQLIRSISTEVQYRNNVAIAYYNDQNKIVNVVGSTVTLESPLQYPLTVSPYTVTVTYTTPISNIFVDGFKMLGGGVRQNPLTNGLGPCGIWGNFVENIVIQNCKFYGFQGIAVGIDGTRDLVVSDCYFEGIDANTTIVEGQNSSFYAAYAFRARRVLFTRCIGQRVRHLYDGAEVYQFVQSDSNASNTHKAAYGSHEEVYDLDIVGNVSYGCYAGVVLRCLTANVTGNTFTAGTANNVKWVGYEANLGINTADMLYTDPGQARFVINSNRIYSYGTGTGAISITASVDQLTISDNLLVGDNPSVQFNNADANLKNVVITGNVFTFNGGAPTTSAVSFTTTSGINGVVNGVLIAHNVANGYGGNMISLYGATNVAAPADNIKITDNLGISATQASGNGIILRNGGFYGEHIVIRGNSQWNDDSAVVSVCPGQTYRLRAFPVVELNDENVNTSQGNRAVAYGASSTPTILDDATLFRGSVIQNTLSSAGGPNYWVVTTGGTNGTITGVTGAITAGTNILTLSGNAGGTNVYAGCFITVVGAGVAGANLVRVRVESIDPTFTTATLSSNASTTVSTATVTRANPTVSAGANLV